MGKYGCNSETFEIRKLKTLKMFGLEELKKTRSLKQLSFFRIFVTQDLGQCNFDILETQARAC